MPISDEDLDGFMKAYEKSFGEPISRDEAQEMFSRLLHLYRRIRRAELQFQNTGTTDEPSE